MNKDKTFKASHFENIQELINTCKMWIRDDDYDAYCRFFDMGAMEELLNELEKKYKIIDAMALQLSGISIWDNQKEEPIILVSEDAVKEYYERKVKDE